MQVQEEQRRGQFETDMERRRQEEIQRREKWDVDLEAAKVQEQTRRQEFDQEQKKSDSRNSNIG